MTDRRYPQFSLGEMNRRWGELRRLMAEAGAEAAVVRGAGAFSREIYYLTDWQGFTPPRPQIAAAPVEEFVTAAHIDP